MRWRYWRNEMTSSNAFVRTLGKESTDSIQNGIDNANNLQKEYT